MKTRKNHVLRLCQGNHGAYVALWPGKTLTPVFARERGTELKIRGIEVLQSIDSTHEMKSFAQKKKGGHIVTTASTRRKQGGRSPYKERYQTELALEVTKESPSCLKGGGSREGEAPIILPAGEDYIFIEGGGGE